ncbi:hypothetical protein Lal_00023371 [Lupinus albus]|nr:hypothetical protein Lal_00023371 [Lupinus albus]
MGYTGGFSPERELPRMGEKWQTGAVDTRNAYVSGTTSSWLYATFQQHQLAVGASPSGQRTIHCIEHNYMRKEMNEQNSKNKAQQKWRHRTGLVNFGVIRVRLVSYFNYKRNYLNYLALLLDYNILFLQNAACNKEIKEMPNQAEMLCETRKNKKGEPLDQETTSVIAQLKDLIENSSQQLDEAFQSVFEKEKPGRVRCHGRVTTPTLLKRKEEIATIEKKHAKEIKLLNDKVKRWKQNIRMKCHQWNKNFKFC